MDFSFFITNNSSGYKTKEAWFSKNHPNEYSKIIKYCEDLGIGSTFKEKIYLYYHHISETPTCKCGNKIKFRNRFDKAYGDYCSLTCANNDKEELIKRQKKSLKNKYGVDFYPQHKEFIRKVKKTKKNRYGDENYNNHVKSKRTRKIRYGNENYNNQTKNKSTCIDRYGVDNYAKSKEFKKQLFDNYKELYPDLEIINYSTNFSKIKCSDCGEIYEINKQLLYERYKRSQIICTLCNPIGFTNRSSHEHEISKYLNQLNIEHITNHKISGVEYDIFIPNKNIGIEINGLYWHNENFKDKDFHLKKTKHGLENGVDVLHVFEDEWLYNKEIILSILKNKVGIIENRIYGRNCKIITLQHNTAKDFLDENHIQGYANSSIRYGLTYNNQLVSVMTFSKGRIIMGGKKNEYELNRFANLKNCVVIGAASKLFKQFLKDHNPTRVVSYSDLRLFNGNMYKNLGFEKTRTSPPNYWYVVGDVRRHRYNYTKSKLVSEGYSKNKTEKEIMYGRKIYRIYDCGNYRWDYTTQKK